MSPQRPDLVLTSYVPHIELGILICDGLDVEADGGDRGDIGVEFELVEDCCSSFNNQPLCLDQAPRCVLLHVLVFPAASKPSINRRISFDPKILFINLEMFCPMAGGGFYGTPAVRTMKQVQQWSFEIFACGSQLDMRAGGMARGAADPKSRAEKQMAGRDQVACELSKCRRRVPESVDAP